MKIKKLNDTQQKRAKVLSNHTSNMELSAYFQLFFEVLKNYIKIVKINKIFVFLLIIKFSAKKIIKFAVCITIAANLIIFFYIMLKKSLIYINFYYLLKFNIY